MEKLNINELNYQDCIIKKIELDLNQPIINFIPNQTMPGLYLAVVLDELI